MRIAELIEIAQRIIGQRMELDYFSRLYGTVIFRQFKDKISEAEIQEIQDQLIQYGIYSQYQVTAREFLLRVLAQFPQIKKENKSINLVLFLLTILTTMITGALFVGRDPFDSISGLISGLPYSIGVLLILATHEFGHYYYSIKNRIYATLPYFLPGIGFGTFGAFIKMKSPIPNKKALFDVGVAGPVAGFIMSLIVLISGFLTLPSEEGVRTFVESLHPWSETGEGAFTLGESLLFMAIRNLMGADYLPMWEVYHFPLIFAGWIGLFVTALNLMPIGQLDGGHISYAMFGQKSKYIGWAAFLILVFLCFFSSNWIPWTILIVILMRFKHPPTMNDTENLDLTRKILAYFSYIIFILCFSPIPFIN